MTLALLIFRLKQQTRLNTQKKLTLREQQEVKKKLHKGAYRTYAHLKICSILKMIYEWQITLTDYILS